MRYRAPIRNPEWPEKGPKYWLQGWIYFDPRTGKMLTIPGGHPSDGATGPFVPDIRSMGWQVHDVICAMDRPQWDDSSPIYPWTAARILHDIMHREGHHLRDVVWGIMTLSFGCRSTWNNVPVLAKVLP